MGKITDGIITAAGYMMIAVELPKAIIKNAIGKKHRKSEKKLDVTETQVVDINKLPKDSQDWIRKMYNKKNGIV